MPLLLNMSNGEKKHMLLHLQHSPRSLIQGTLTTPTTMMAEDMMMAAILVEGLTTLWM